MAQPGFYNNNINRAYPFVFGSENNLPEFAVADFGTIMSAESGYVEGQHSVYLAAVRRFGSLIEFEFQTDAPGLLGKSLIFRRRATDSKYATDYAEAEDSTGPVAAVGCRIDGSTVDVYIGEDGSLGSVGSVGSVGTVTFCDSVQAESCHGDVPWSGYLVSGDMRLLATIIPACEDLAIGELDHNPEILFLIDSTATNGELKASLLTLLPYLDEVLVEYFPTNIPKYAVVEYKDFEDAGDFAVAAKKVRTAFTDSLPEAETAVNLITVSGGGDAPDGQLAALAWVLANWNTGLAGSDNGRVLVWLGDTSGWENGAKGNAYPTLAAVKAALAAANCQLCVINTRESGEGLDGLGNSQTPGGAIDGNKQASSLLAVSAGGSVNNGVNPEDAAQIGRLIMSTVVNAFAPASVATCGGFVGPATVEPSQVQNLDGAYVRSVNVANGDRTRATSSADCRDLCWSFPLQDHYIVCECVIGDIRFKAGYNTEIRVLPAENSIVIGGRVGGGEGEPCEEVRVFPEEDPPSGRTRLDGSLGCDEVVRSINGVGGRFFEISGSAGVVITPVPDKHKIIIDISMVGLAICPDPPAELEVSDPTYSDDPCECGPKE